MNNFVQNISIDDIIPNDFYEPDSDEENLTKSIQKHGIIEPLMLRPNNGKYEIILGNKRYKIAKKLGFKTVPAYVREIDNELYEEYKKINSLNKQKNEQNKFINTLSEQNETNIIPKRRNTNILSNEQDLNQPIINFQNNISNKDIVNLSELNKEEYIERDEYNMNNNMIGNQEMQNNNQNTQQPTFGGRFFPSLEDEPTNMNLGGININNQIEQPQTIPNQQPESSNLIDLTDTSAGREVSPVQPSLSIPEYQNFAPQNQPIAQPEAFQPSNNLNVQIETPTPMMNSVLDTNLQQAMPNSNASVTPNIVGNQLNDQPEPINNFSNNFASTIPQETNQQFDMSQSVMPNLEANSTPDPVSNINIQQNTYQPEMPSIDNQLEQAIPNQLNEINPMENTNFEESNVNSFPNSNLDLAQPIQETSQSFPQKEVEPVISSIKSLATSLQKFGYEINITEDDLPTVAKITIEVKK